MVSLKYLETYVLLHTFDWPFSGGELVLVFGRHSLFFGTVGGKLAKFPTKLDEFLTS